MKMVKLYVEIEIVKDLKEQIKYVKARKQVILFPNSNNNYTDPRKVNDYLTRILKSFDISGISTHSLRYTFATRCAESGMKDVVLKNLMGHYDIEVTKNVYIDIQKNFEQDEIKKVEKYMKKYGI